MPDHPKGKRKSLPYKEYRSTDPHIYSSDDRCDRSPSFAIACILIVSFYHLCLIFLMIINLYSDNVRLHYCKHVIEYRSENS